MAGPGPPCRGGGSHRLDAVLVVRIGARADAGTHTCTALCSCSYAYETLYRYTYDHMRR